MSEAPTQPRRRWFQFSILSLLVLTAVVAVLFAMVVVPARRQRNAVAAILDLGGQVGYDYQAAPGATAPPAPAWLRKLFGDDCFQTVTSVGLVSKEFEDPDKITAALEQTAMLPNVDALGIDAAGLRDDHALQIARLQSFTRLRLAWYAAGQFTGAGVARLKNLTELHTLALEGAISDAELPAVGKLTQLRSLGLGGTVSDAGMEHLLPLFNLEHLDCRVDSRAARVLAALAEPTELELEDVAPLNLMDFVSRKHKIRHWFDDRAMSDAGISLQTITLTDTVKGISLREALERILRPHGLGFRVEDDQLVITMPEEVERAHAGIDKLREALPNLRDVQVGW